MRVKRVFCNALIPAIGFFSQFLFINSCVGANYGGGNGTAEAPYLISEPNHLHCIHTEPNDWDKHFLLVNDIDLSNHPDLVFNPIGGEHTDPFTGVFDGNSYTIINFTCVSTRSLSVGLFGYANAPAVIKNLGLIDPNIQAENSAYVGSLAGEISNCTIENCWAVGIQAKGAYVVGGLFGFSWYGSEDYPIVNCHASGRVEGKGSVGGLIGSNRGYIKNCRAECQVISTGNYAGGLAGSSTDVILNSYSKCDVTGIDYVGGLVGSNYNRHTDGTYDSDIKIVSCYSTGSVSGNECVGGLVGGLSESLVYGCYSTSEVSGASLTGGLVGDITDGRVLNSIWDIQTSGQVISAGGQGKSTEQMQSSETFIIAWSCQPVWTIDDGNDYPHLVWENQPGVLIERFTYGGGEGTSANPYMICTAEQLNTIGLLECDWDKHFKLMEDIDLSSYDANNLNLLGDYIDYNENTPFTGMFDGNSHSISNFSYTSFDQSMIGLFRYVGGSLAKNAWIKNLTLINPQVNGGNGRRIGSLVGMLKYGTVVNCSVKGGTVEGNYETGGLVGYFKGYRTLGYAISDCNTDIDVSGSSGVGGLVGNNESGEITNCSSIGDVYGSGDGAGGLIGYSSGIIYGCFSNGNVEGENLVGGLVGSSKESITDSYATGSVVGIGDFIGGLAGRHFGGVISNSYARGDVSGGGLSVGGLVGSNAGGIDYSKISNCYATGSVEGGEIVGGLAGYNWEGYIFNSYAIGPVIGNKDVGGLAGYNLRGDISNSYANGSVAGDENVGGLVGRNSYDGDIINSYATGLVTGNIKVGGLIGYGNILPFTNPVVDSFWDVNSTGLSLSGGGQGKTTVEMQTLETYQPWFCAFLWKIDEGNDYPRFVWEDGPGEPMVPPNYAGGSGVPADPYRIETAEQMNTISLYPCQWAEHFVLVDDIDLSDYDGQEGRPAFNIIGKDDSFTGVFDGNGHTISNFTYEVTDGSSDIGLFAFVGYKGDIQDLTLKNATILGNGSYVGAFTGVCSGNITNCASINGNVQGNNFIGGLIGSFIYGTISNSFAKGSVLGDNNVVGGLVGTTEGYGGIIDNSYSQGIVSGYGDVGGFLGIGSIPIHHCYSSCEVTGLINVGAMTGYAKTSYPPPPYPYPPPPPPTYHKCFWEKTLNPDLEGIGNNIVDPNLVGLTTVEFMTIQPFEDAGWDFLNIWSICEGTNYPHLQWHIPQGDYICPDGVNFYDFAHFSQRWLQDNCYEINNYCDGADLDNLGSVGLRDLAIFCDYWLVGVR